MHVDQHPQHAFNRLTTPTLRLVHAQMHFRIVKMSLQSPTFEKQASIMQSGLIAG